MNEKSNNVDSINTPLGGLGVIKNKQYDHIKEAIQVLRKQASTHICVERCQPTDSIFRVCI